MTIKYSMEEEYLDCYFINNLYNKMYNNNHNNNNHNNNTLQLTQEFNEKFFSHTRKSMTITPLLIMKDDIKNYRPLTDIQLEQVKQLSEEEKLELIKTFNIMIESIKMLI